jgi:hypothetical protein
MDSEKTFNVLKRISLDEMEDLIDIRNFTPTVSPCMKIGEMAFDTSLYYRRDLEIQQWREKLLGQNGWDFEGFVKETERKALLAIISRFNASVEIPQNLIDRARQYFPNAKFIHAKVELE